MLMGVLRYTQDGSTGASDGEEISDQWRAESDEASGEAAPHTHTHTQRSAPVRVGTDGTVWTAERTFNYWLNFQ